MAITNPFGGLRARSSRLVSGPILVLSGAVVAVVAMLAMPHQALTQAALLPAAIVLLYLLAAVVALMAWRRPVPARGLSYRDVAGFLVVIGILIATQVEPEQIVRIVTAHNPS